MTRIINRKRYDTDTATEVATWSNGYGHSDFKYVDETLYRTPKGNWFLVAEGGALSKYAQSCGNGFCGGDALLPFEPDQACQWLETHHRTEALEQYFPSDIEDA